MGKGKGGREKGEGRRGKGEGGRGKGRNFFSKLVILPSHTYTILEKDFRIPSGLFSQVAKFVQDLGLALGCQSYPVFLRLFSFFFLHKKEFLLVLETGWKLSCQ